MQTVISSSTGIQFIDHLRIMGFLVLLFTTLSAVQFAEARVLDHQLPNVANNSAVTFDSDLDAVAVSSSRQNYTGPGGHVVNYSESNPGISSENSTHAANNTIITIELLQKEATPGDGSSSKAPAGIEEAAPIDDNTDSLHEILSSHSSPGIAHISLNDRSEGNILSSGQSPGVGHWEKSKNKYSTSPARTTPNNHVLSSGPSPGVGNGHTSAIAGTQSELGTLNKLPSGPSPGVGHEVTNGFTEMVQESESKKSTMIMNILPSGPSPGEGNSATNGRNTMEKISIESEPKKKTAFNQESESKKESAVIMNILPSGPSPGVGNSATNGRNMMEKISIESESKKKTSFTQKPEPKKKSEMMMNILPSGPSPGVGNSVTNRRNTMEKISKEDEEGMGIQTFNRLPSGPSPGVGHSYTNAYQPEKLQRTLENRKDSDIPIFHKLPGGPSPGGGHSYVEKSALTVRMLLSSNTLRKTSSGSGPGDEKSSISKFRPARGIQKKKAERTKYGAVDGEIRCDGGGLDFYGTPTPPMFGIAAAES